MSKLQQTLLPIKLEESKERLTSLTGLLLVEEWGRAKGVWARVDQLFRRPGSGRSYAASEYVRALVWLLHAGGRRLEDVRELAAEQGVLAQLGLKRIPSADAIGDWLRRQGKGSGVRSVQQTSNELIRSFLKSLGEEITIDPDATIIEADKREAEWTYQKVKGYQPLPRRHSHRPRDCRDGSLYERHQRGVSFDCHALAQPAARSVCDDSLFLSCGGYQP